nr:MAG TPA: hypothetical protein [Crassvirales sp.]
MRYLKVLKSIYSLSQMLLLKEVQWLISISL